MTALDPLETFAQWLMRTIVWPYVDQLFAEGCDREEINQRLRAMKPQFMEAAREFERLNADG